MLQQNVGVAGQLRYEITTASGDLKESSDWFDNLVVKTGLIQLAQAGGSTYYGGDSNINNNLQKNCAIGSGNAAPTMSQDALQEFVKATYGNQINNSYNYTPGSEQYVLTQTYKYDFTGLNNVNITEVGLCTDDGRKIYTRALIKDSMGQPVSITILSGETLTVYYKLTLVLNTGDTKNNFMLSDDNGNEVPYKATIRLANVGNVYPYNYAVGNPLKNYLDVGGSGRVKANIGVSSNDLSALTTFPSTNLLDLTKNSDTAGVSTKLTQSVDSSSDAVATLATANLGINDANGNIRTIVFLWAQSLALQVRVGKADDDAPIVKDNTKKLLLTIRITFSNYEGTV